jgi:HEAT repeat protein
MKSPRRRRWAIGSCGGLVLAAGAVVLAVWVEERFPNESEERALSPRVQRVLTAPIVEGIGRQLDRIVRRRAQMMYVNSGLTVEETIARFLDEAVDLSQRRHLAYRLAAIGSPECLAALRKGFEIAAPEYRAFLAQLIGSTGSSTAGELLWPLLHDADERVVIGAIRGLCGIRGEDVTTRVAAILEDPRYSDRVRIAAASGLGTIRTAAARDALVRAFGETSPGELQAEILVSLGQFDFTTVARTFGSYLAAAETPAEMRVVAVEALAHSSAAAVPFLLQLARADADAEVRASAAWAISAHQAVNHLGPALTRLAEREPEPDVRRRLYEALLPQSTVPADRLLPTVMAEEDIAARVAGFNALGRGAHQRPASPIAQRFDAEIVPELLHIATAPNSLNIQMRAVFALRRAQTPAARIALAQIAGSGAPQVATAARNGLRATSG